MSRKACTPTAAPLDDLVILPELKFQELQVFTEIGKGRFKAVSSGRYSRHGQVAVLKYNKDAGRNDIDILAHLNQRNASNHILEVYGYGKEITGFILTQELSAFGSVRSVLRDHELKHVLTLSHKLQIARQFAEAVSFLESVNVVHTDIACRNFLVTRLDDDSERMKVKLTDFAFSVVLPPKVGHVVKKLPQATRWCAPETVSFNKWSVKTDIWSLGVTLWELFADGAIPWTNYAKRADVAGKLRELAQSSSSEACADLFRAFAPADTSSCPLPAHQALLSCLQVEAAARPSCQNLAHTLSNVLCQKPDAPQVETYSPLVHERRLSKAMCQKPDAPEAEIPRPLVHERRVSAPAPMATRGLETSVTERVQRPSESRSTLLDSTKQSSESTEFKSRGMLTPPTRCPSSAAPTRCPSSAAGSAYSDAAESRGQKPCNSSSIKRVATPRQQELLDSIKALCHDTAAFQNKKTLENIEAFLSTPEALCGLGLEKQMLLRHKLANAKAHQEVSCRQAPRLIYQDTIIPLIPLGGRVGSAQLRNVGFFCM